MSAPIVFDLDGTLIDSAPDLLHSANRLLEEMQAEPLDIATLRRFIGNGTPTLVRRILDARNLNGAEAAHARFMKIYMENPTGHTSLFEGARATLQTLHREGIALGICTNKPHAATVSVLDTLDIAEFFGVVIGGDSLAVLKPDPAPLAAAFDRLGAASGIFVGDSEVDAATAEALGVPFALYTEGYRKSAPAEMPHTVAFADFGGATDVLIELSRREAGSPLRPPTPE